MSASCSNGKASLDVCVFSRVYMMILEAIRWRLKLQVTECYYIVRMHRRWLVLAQSFKILAHVFIVC